MEKRVFITSSVLLFISTSLLFAPLFSVEPLKGVSTSQLEFEDWERKEEPRNIEGEALFDYLGSGAEIFLEYGFKSLYLSRYTSQSGGRKKEIILEVYWMGSADSAFGIFSVKRTGEEKASEQINALNWVSESQVNMVKAEYFININCFNCEGEDLEKFAARVPRRIIGEGELPLLLSFLPSKNLMPRTEKYLKGHVAASGESVFLGKEFWGFKYGTIAVSARYSPSNSKVIIFDFGERRVQVTEMVKELFEEYLEEVEVIENNVQGKISFGHYFLFSQKGTKGVLILGERDLESAHSLLGQVLGKI